MSPETIQQLIVATLAVGLLLATVRLARRGRLSFGVATLWAGLALTALIGAAVIPLVESAASAVGVIPAALLAGAVLVVLGTIVLLLSLRLAGLESAVQELAESVATEHVTPPLPPPTDETESALVVVPAFNEERSVGTVVDDLRREGMTVLVVDDGSRDRTAAVARERGASVLRLPTNLGVGGALRAGARHAVERGYRRIIQCDGDGQHPACEVLRLTRIHEQDPVHLLVGSRFLTVGSRRGTPLVRRAGMMLLSRVAGRASGMDVTDASSGLRVIQEPLLSEVARHLPRHYLGDTFELYVAAGRAGYRIREEAVTMRDRSHGASSASFVAAVGLTLRSLLVVALRAHLPLDGPDRSEL